MEVKAVSQLHSQTVIAKLITHYDAGISGL